MTQEILPAGDKSISRQDARISYDNELIKLPEDEKLSTDSEEFFAVSVDVLPENIRNDVKLLAKNQKISYSRFEITLCSLITLAIVFVGIKFLLPSPPEVITVDDGISNTGIIQLGEENESPTRQEKSLLDKMQEHFTAQRYAECIKLLPEKKVMQIIDNRERFSPNSQAVNCVLNAMQLINLPPEEKEECILSAIRISQRLTQAYPDSIAWHLQRLTFENYNIVVKDSFETINTDIKNGVELGRLQSQIRYIENIKFKNDNPELQRKFDLICSKIYIACWLNYLPYDSTHISKPSNSNGFHEREKALKNIEKYAQNSLEFLALKEFIVRTIMKMDTWYRGYEFNKIKYYRAKHLDTILEEIAHDREKLIKASNGKGK